jgi:cytochrome P450
VGVPQFAAYRHASFFAHPDEFHPERWLPEDSSYHDGSVDIFSQDVKRVVQPFSVGPRNCIGMNLAYAEMRLIFTRLLYNFDFCLPSLGPGEELFKFEDQKTFALWEREPCVVVIRPK